IMLMPTEDVAQFLERLVRGLVIFATEAVTVPVGAVELIVAHGQHMNDHPITRGLVVPEELFEHVMARGLTQTTGVYPTAMKPDERDRGVIIFKGVGGDQLRNHGRPPAGAKVVSVRISRA